MQRDVGSRFPDQLCVEELCVFFCLLALEGSAGGYVLWDGEAQHRLGTSAKLSAGSTAVHLPQLWRICGSRERWSIRMDRRRDGKVVRPDRGGIPGALLSEGEAVGRETDDRRRIQGVR